MMDTLTEDHKEYFADSERSMGGKECRYYNRQQDDYSSPAYHFNSHVSTYHYACNTKHMVDSKPTYDNKPLMDSYRSPSSNRTSEFSPDLKTLDDKVIFFLVSTGSHGSCHFPI